ncbi:MAG TPA: SRPBCC family protein [Thermoanaerobaculia bacterium]|nr:SRPBCC family protein [Thermoanaerobaculia bacterium]HQR66648.1 SRPBCC family protein [Thermoanaerobaculia bacterium]
MPVLEFRLPLPGATRQDLFEFHRSPLALERLSPPSKKLKVVECPKSMRGGARVVLSVRQYGIPLTWVSLITDWDPPHRFSDVQEKGPFARWKHQHLFRDGLLIDRIDYEVPLRRLGGRLVDVLLVRPDLVRMFRHRHAVTAAALRPPA